MLTRGSRFAVQHRADPSRSGCGLSNHPDVYSRIGIKVLVLALGRRQGQGPHPHLALFKEQVLLRQAHAVNLHAQEGQDEEITKLVNRCPDYNSCWCGRPTRSICVQGRRDQAPPKQTLLWQAGP